MRRIIIPLLVGLCGAYTSFATPPSQPTPAVSRDAPIASEACDCGPAAVCRCLRICFVQNGWLREVPVVYNVRTGDTLTVDSLPISSLAPLTGEYASVAGWYVHGEPIAVRGRPFVRSGLPRVLGVDELARVGEYRGVGLYADAADTASAAHVLYLPTRPGCEFQPYMRVDSIPARRR